jgi:excisionase family DNA binding protein
MDHSIENSVPLQKPLAVTVPIALNLTGIGRTKLYQLIDNGAVESIRIGRRRLINYASLERLVNNAGEPLSGPRQVADLHAS